MAKRALLDVLSSTIGRYVRDLDEEKLNVAVWSGKIELSNLSLDVDAVNNELARQAREAPNLAIPLRVVEGRFDTLQVEVPWARITSRPVVVKAAGLKMVVEPHSHLSGKQPDEEGGTDTDGKGTLTSSKAREKLVKRAKDTRAQNLKFADESRRRANAVRKLAAFDSDADGAPSRAPAASAGGGGTEIDGSTFAGRLVRRIAENLQLDFESVNVTLRGCGCSAGVVLGSLSLFTTDANGKRTFVDRGLDVPNDKERTVSDSFLYKELQIQGLGVYCDEDEVSPLERIQQRLNTPSSDHSYILSPLSFVCRLRRSDMLRCVDFPKYLVVSELKTLSIVLSRSQLDLTRRISESIAAKKDVLRPLFPEYRPCVPIGKDTAKEWWRYAFRCIGRLNRRRCWAEFYIAFQKRKKYIALYKRFAHHASCPWLAKLTIAETAEMDYIEQDHSISSVGIMCWRNIADAQVDREQQKHEESTVGRGTGRNRQEGVHSSGQRNNPWASVFGRAGDRANNPCTSNANSARNIGSENGIVVEQESGDEDEAPPIELSAEEMQELEAIGLNTSEEALALSADSILCNINFTLGSFRVNLVSYGLQALTSLQMGTVSMAFEAMANGSFQSSLTMASLTIDDMVTPRSLFPCVVKSLQAPAEDKGSPFNKGALQHALDFSYNKSKVGDQTFVLRMVAYELVASSLLVKEVSDFFSVRSLGSRSGGLKTPQKRNPILQESMTGSVDLFYDADYGESDILSPSAASMQSSSSRSGDDVDIRNRNPHNSTTAAMSERLAMAFADAWRSKTKRKTNWTIDVDIHAPILVVPESCTDREASVLIFDLGSFHFVYGKNEANPDVRQWFHDNPNQIGGSTSAIDHCSLDVQKLTFLLSKAGGWVALSNAANVDFVAGESVQVATTTVIEPVSLSLNIGIENNQLSLDQSRKCIFGVLPDITIQASPSSVASIFRTYAKWDSFLDALLAESADQGKRAGSKQFAPLIEEESEEEEEDASKSGGIQILAADKMENDSIYPNNDGTSTPCSPVGSPFPIHNERQIEHRATGAKAMEEDPSEYIYLSLALRKLSAKLTLDSTKGLEAHLVSVVVSSTISSDGASTNRCRMGWFWLLDSLPADFPREQRILAHSLLPRPSSEYYREGAYSVLRDLEKEGVFRDDYSGSSDLADISVTRTVSGPMETLSVDATFTSLFLNWNPRAIKSIMSRSSSLFEIGAPSSGRSGQRRGNEILPSALACCLSLKARMTSFNISLNSAIDDLALYTLTMADAKLDAVISDLKAAPNDQSIDSTFVVGDIKMETSAAGKALDEYTTIIGLASGQSSSLLTVKYEQGEEALKSRVLKDDNLDKSSFAAVVDVTISPIRFVYIQAQILTLTEYVTEGVLGALFAKVASSAAAAAIEIAQTTEEDKDKLFQIRATGLDLVLPETARSMDYFSIKADDLEVQYIALANDQGGKAKCYVSDVMMACNQNLQMLTFPIRISIDVFVSAIEGKTEEDRAIKVDVDVSEASFLLTRTHYSQIMDTLEGNISQEDSFLRDVNVLTGVNTIGDAKGDEDDPASAITHGGVDFILLHRHIYVEFVISKLAIDLCRESDNTDESLVSLAAVEANILLRLYPEQEKVWSRITLHDLVCDDKRIEALNRKFRRIISCHHDVTDVKKVSNDSAKNANDLFVCTYQKTNRDETTEVNLMIGSPQIVLVPDCLVEILEFLKAGIRPPPAAAAARIGSKNSVTKGGNGDGVTVNTTTTDGLPFTTSCQQSATPVTKQQMKIDIKAHRCRLIFVDMGSAPSVDSSSLTMSLNKAAQLTETIVIEGKIEGSVDLTSDIMTGEAIGGDHQLHGENVEVYTAQGIELVSPVQIMEPAVFSVFITTAVLENGLRQEVDLKTVTLSHIEMTLSMQNIALMKAIASSISDSFADADSKRSEQATKASIYSLSDQEKLRIERLASALDKVEEKETEQSIHPDRTYSRIEGSNHDNSATLGTAATNVSYIIRAKATIPETIITVVNDLQGLDDALFKLLFKNFVFGGEFDFPSEPGALPLFRFHVNTGIVSNYFDTNSLLWESLLLKEWQINFNGMRAPQKRFSSSRMSTSFDIDSHPCYLSFSEQFLVSIGAATKMWGVYSSASQKAADLGAVIENVDRSNTLSTQKGSLALSARKSLAACAARSLITTMPYGIENHSGVIAHFSTRFGNRKESRRPCESGETQYFQFEPLPGDGTGGKRLYGQDVVHVKTLEITIGDSTITFDHVDAEINCPRKPHLLANGLYVFTQVVRDMKAIVVHLSSHVDISNATPIPLAISVKSDEALEEIGVCPAISEMRKGKGTTLKTGENDTISSQSAGFGIPIHKLQALNNRAQRDDGKPSVVIAVSPQIGQDGNERHNLYGEVVLPSLGNLVQIATGNSCVQSFEITCTPKNKQDRGQQQDAVAVQICCRVTLVGSYHPFVELFFQPRALFQNNLPVSVMIRTPMPHTFSAMAKQVPITGGERSADETYFQDIGLDTRAMAGQTIHVLQPFESLKVLTPGPSIALAALCADQPSGGRRTGWMDGGWVDIPLGRNVQLPEPCLCLFPFIKRGGEPPAVARGSEFLILEGNDGLPQRDEVTHQGGGGAGSPKKLTSSQERRNIAATPANNPNDPIMHIRTLSIGVQNYAVDHTGDILFEQVGKVSATSPARASSIHAGATPHRRSFHPPHLETIPFSAFSSPYHQKRITLLPSSDVPIRILKLTMDGDIGTKRSLPFTMEEIPLSEGGIESKAITWADENRSSYFAFRRLSSANQYELHVIPEFVVYNGSTTEKIIVKQSGDLHTPLDPGGVAPVHSQQGPGSSTGLILMIEFEESLGSTAPIQVNSLGIKICVVRTTTDGSPIGSVAIQTVIGNRDSRLVIKIGALKRGGLAGKTDDKASASSGEIFADDFFRFRIRWSEMEVTLIDTQRAVGSSYDKNREAFEAALREKNHHSSDNNLSLPTKGGKAAVSPALNAWSQGTLPYRNVAQFLLHRFTVDFQRIFKDEEAGSKTTKNAALISPERTQLAVIIHSVRITDCDPDAVSPTVLESSTNSPFFDLCIRTRGSHSADLVKVDLLDLNMSYANGKADCIVISTGEDFLWRLFDVAHRTLEATAALAGVDIELEWDEERGAFNVSTMEIDRGSADYLHDFRSKEVYQPPRSDTLFDIRTARISPVSFLVSFKRQPSLSRYQLVKGVRGAKLMNYATTRLKFTVDKADIRFAGYITKNVKGPPDRLIEMVTAVYSSRMKLKLVTLLNSVTLQDWRYLSGREDRGDEYVEGDILRLTGNLAGRSAGYVLKKVGQGLGDGVSTLTASVGDEIQRSSERVGAGAVGASVNSVVSGLGDGVGSSIKGVGAGSGKLFRGAGKGIGQAIGGVGGGVILAAKGIGKGITSGDGKAVISGLGDGLNSMGTGIGRGVETAALGATDGVLTAGQGLVSGVGSVGRGIGNAFRVGGGSMSTPRGIDSQMLQQEEHQRQGNDQQPQQPWRPGQRIRERRERRRDAPQNF